MKIIYSETIEKMEFIDIKFVIFREVWISYYELLKIKDQKNLEMNTLE